jgi:hypothetical protein
MKLKLPPNGWILSADSWLRMFGFHCTINSSTSVDNEQATRIWVGYKPPFLITRKIVSIYLHFVRFGCSLFDVSILPSFIRVQNQVHIDSPFMRACITGDSELIRQYVEEDREILHSRSICSGRTPLLVSPLLNHARSILVYGIS